MPLIQKIVILGISIFFLLLVLELIRRRKLFEKYALFWIVFITVMIIFSFFPNLLFLLAKFLFLHHLTVFFLISFVFLVLVVLYFSVQHSRLSEKNKELTQEVGILGLKVKQLEDKLNQPDRHK